MAKVMPMNVGNLAKKMVLLKLADQANDDGFCWPSYQTIAEACQVSRRTVIRHIKSLEADGFLTITKTYDKANKKNFSNKYQLTLDRGVKLSLVTESHHPSDTVSISGDTVSPKPIIEPTIDPINTLVSEKKETKKTVKYKPVKPESVSEQIWNDLLILRKETKASNSQTAWTTVFNGLAKAQQATGHSLDQIITFWIGKAWKGFNADWYLNAQPKPQQTNYQGNSHADSQSANSQPKQSSADVYAAKLAEQRRQREAANTTATGSDRANVYDMEETF